MSSQTQRRSRSPSPVSRLNVPRRVRSLERTRNEEVFFDDDDVDWPFDPAIDAILEAHGQKRKRDEAFSDDDNVSDNIFVKQKKKIAPARNRT